MTGDSGIVILMLLLASVIGAAIGGLVGVLSAVVVARRERTGMRSDSDRRRTGLVTSAAPFVLFAAIASAQRANGWVGIWLLCALLSGVAGALLAPRLVRPWRNIDKTMV